MEETYIWKGHIHRRDIYIEGSRDIYTERARDIHTKEACK